MIQETVINMMLDNHNGAGIGWLMEETLAMMQQSLGNFVLSLNKPRLQDVHVEQLTAKVLIWPMQEVSVYISIVLFSDMLFRLWRLMRQHKM